MEEILQQLINAGLPKERALAAIKAASRMSPVDGATELKKHGADYRTAFKALCEPVERAKVQAEEMMRDEAAHDFSISPMVWIIFGLGLIIAGYIVSKLSYNYAVENGEHKFYVFKGLFLLAAIVSSKGCIDG
jgi:hypothetical protein